MDVSLAIRRRLEELGLEQKGLARAARVTESYVSQLLTRKKAPPAPNRTDIYEKMDKFLKLPSGELARLADAQRKQQLKRELGDEPAPLFGEVRALIVSKCAPKSKGHIRAIFEKQPFGELERLVTGKLLEVVKRVAQEELENDAWLHKVAGMSGRSYEEMRVIVLEFLDTDIFHVSAEHCVSFLDPLIASWDVDLATFALEIILNHRVAAEHLRRFEFVERGSEPLEEPGLREFLQDHSLSGTATAEELELLRKLRFKSKRPTALYYYRELQSLRDPLHFRAAQPARGGPAIRFTQHEESAMSTATKARPKLRITPLEDRVVVAPDDEAEAMRGGLYIPDTAKEKPTRGRLVAVGAGRYEKGARIPMDVKVGDTVLYGKYSGTEITLEGEEVMIIKASDILAKLG